jgi:hypothetical protein
MGWPAAGVGRAAVRLYLWSFRAGGNPEHLTAPVGEDGRRAVVIASALDDASAHVRRAGAERELSAVVGLGVDPVELDLREYFGQEQRRAVIWHGCPRPGCAAATCSCSDTRCAGAV